MATSNLRTGAAAALAVAALATGCSVKATPPPFVPPAPAAQQRPVETTEPTNGPTEAPADPEGNQETPDGGLPPLGPSDGGGEPLQPSDGGGEHPGFEIPARIPEVTVDLSPESATAVTYLRPMQAFSPELEVWEIDGADVYFRSYNCAGGLTHEVYATLVDNGDLTVTARWEGDAPGELVGWSASDESVLQIDERTLRPVPGGSDTIASTRTELELQDYAGMCTDAGKTLAAFIL